MSDLVLFSISFAITVLGFLAAWGAYRRKGAASGMRAGSWALVPMAAYLTGLTEWLTGLAFSPLKWAGVVLAGLAAVLYVVSGVMLARQPARAARAGGAASGGRAEEAGRGSASPRAGAPKRIERRRDPVIDDDLADVEEILRRRGIR